MKHGHGSNFEELVQQFGMRVGLADMKLDNSGLCRVVLENVVNIDLELSSDGQSLYLYSALPQIDDAQETTMMKALLGANYALHRSCNCRFAYDENANEWVLLEVVSNEGITLDSLDQVLQNFARTATTWNSNCRRGEFTGSGSESHEQHSSGPDPQVPFV